MFRCFFDGVAIRRVGVLNLRRVIVLCVGFILSGCSVWMKPVFSQVTVSFDDTTVELELADTHERRWYGLMNRDQLCDSCGMVFVYDSPKKVHFWMKDTHIPLDLAYISEQGVVVQIFSLTPNDLVGVESSLPVKYAIEMNQGWFERHQITVGSRFQLIDGHQRKRQREQ